MRKPPLHYLTYFESLEWVSLAIWGHLKAADTFLTGKKGWPAICYIYRFAMNKRFGVCSPLKDSRSMNKSYAGRIRSPVQCLFVYIGTKAQVSYAFNALTQPLDVFIDAFLWSPPGHNIGIHAVKTLGSRKTDASHRLRGLRCRYQFTGPHVPGVRVAP